MPKKSQSKSPTLPKLCNAGVYAYAYFNSQRVRFGRSDDPDHQKRFADFLTAWLANGRKTPDSPKPSRAFRNPPAPSADSRNGSADRSVITVVESVVEYFP